MLSKIISPGDRLELDIAVSPEKKKQLVKDNSVFAKTLVSQIYDLIDETQIKIAMPMVEGRVIPLPVNSIFEMCAFTAGGLYRSKFIVLERFKENNIYVMVVELVSELKKFQRRQYFRLEYAAPIGYIVINEQLVKSLEEDKELVKDILDKNVLKKGITIDISGGGMRFASDEKLDTDTVILVKIDISISTGKSVYGVLGKVLSSNKLINNELMYEQRVEYLNIKNDVREIIIRYIFEQERKMRLRS